MRPQPLPPLYLDDCADGNLLRELATQAGFTVHTPRSDNTRGWDDASHLEHATHNGCALLTFNADDFKRLHADWQAAGRAHGGILIVYLEHNRRKDMMPRDIVQAVLRLVDSGLPIQNELHVLNHWR